MGFREVTMLEIREVLRRWLRGDSKSEIARQCGVARGTVRSYIRAAERGGLSPGQPESALNDDRLAELVEGLHPDSGRPRGDGWDSCEEQRAFIASRLERDVRLTKIRKLLRRQRVQVSYATLRRYAIAELGYSEGAATIPVADGEPGKEIQVDTGWVGWLKPDLAGRRRRIRAWIFTPGVSRYRFVFPVFRETTETAIEACEAAWEFYGGIFDVLIPDNTSTIVQKADPLKPTINLGFLEYAQARGFVIDAARVGKATDKARVERTVRVVAEDCFGGEEILDLEHARQHARRWCRDDNGMKRHGTTRRFPREHFEAEELARLHPAPDASYDLPLWSEPTVHPDQHAQVDYALYSLPRRHEGQRLIGRQLTARADRSTVRFYLGHELVKVHPRVARGQRQTDPADFPPEKAAYALRDVAFLVRKATEHGPAVARYAEALLDSRLPWTRMRQVYALLGLVKRYGAPRVDEACQAALDVELVDVHHLRRLLEIAPSKAKTSADPAAPNKVVPLARFLRPPHQFALNLTSASEDTKGETRS
jgi:transposase